MVLNELWVLMLLVATICLAMSSSLGTSVFHHLFLINFDRVSLILMFTPFWLWDYAAGTCNRLTGAIDFSRLEEEDDVLLLDHVR